MAHTGTTPTKRKKTASKRKVKKQKTPVTPVAPITTAPVVVTKRPSKLDDISIDLGRPLDTVDERYAADVEANRTALDKIYDEFYDGKGQQKKIADRRKKLYAFMGKGTTDYLKGPISQKDFETFRDAGGTDYEVTSQSLGGDTSRKDPKAVVGKLAVGDYFRVYNKHPAAPGSLKGKARRIVVNVKSQKAALKVAESLTKLYADKDVSPYVRQFKIYLSGKQGDTAKVKYDKLVVYYRTGDETTDNDAVGDAITKAIDTAVTPDDRESAFAPFYARVGPGIAWAEEPKYYVDTLQGSFTSTRRDLIVGVIRKNKNIVGKDAFAKLVAGAFQAAKVDVDHPERHTA